MQNIRGFQPFSLIDYPGQVSAIIFLGGCNLRCQFCHNPELVLTPGKGEAEAEENILSFLDQRKGKLDGVVITGGEPCLTEELVEFIQKIKEKGFLVKLDTNGTNPSLLEKCLKYVDYVAMDIKSSLDRYDEVCGVVVDKEKLKRSVELIKNFENYEFRTTVVRKFFSQKELEEICNWLQGSKKYCLQQFVKKNPIINESLKSEIIYTKEELNKFKEYAEKYFDKVEIRNV
ncbi:MAG: anaerobic ribonucleoside-triphosphate reductase activating protein [Nanoarchaeota archaeon]|nr:anaerobic ribonucleoside-triphosphate reductase activating protein [Nanoarchaeota archaeon]